MTLFIDPLGADATQALVHAESLLHSMRQFRSIAQPLSALHACHSLAHKPVMHSLSWGESVLQSNGQVETLSDDWQNRSPHLEPAEGQSLGQLALFSPASQMPLPHLLAVGQSMGQLAEVSPASQMPLPHLFVAGQSMGQVTFVSSASQAPLPQLSTPIWKQFWPQLNKAINVASSVGLGQASAQLSMVHFSAQVKVGPQPLDFRQAAYSVGQAFLRQATIDDGLVGSTVVSPVVSGFVVSPAVSPVVTSGATTGALHSVVLGLVPVSTQDQPVVHDSFKAHFGAAGSVVLSQTMRR
jgi:hypothetical protein